MKTKYFFLLLFAISVISVNARTIEIYGDSVILSAKNTICGSVQWQFSKDSINWNDIIGANKSELRYKAIESGFYRLKIQNSIEYFSSIQYIEVWKRDFYMNLNSGLNNQGLVYKDNKLYISNDINGINSKIIIYDWISKKALKEIANLPIGHGAELDFQKSTNLMFATNGGGSNPCKVYTVNIDEIQPTVQRTYNLPELGNSSILAIDEEHNIIYVLSTLSGGDYGNTTITPVDITTGIPDLKKQFTLPFIAVPQGAKFKNGKIYFLLGLTSTIIAIIDPIQMKLLDKIIFPNTYEPEGLGIIDDTSNNKFKFVVGYVNDNVYTISF